MSVAATNIVSRIFAPQNTTVGVWMTNAAECGLTTYTFANSYAVLVFLVLIFIILADQQHENDGATGAQNCKRGACYAWASHFNLQNYLRKHVIEQNAKLFENKSFAIFSELLLPLPSHLLLLHLPVHLLLTSLPQTCHPSDHSFLSLLLKDVVVELSTEKQSQFIRILEQWGGGALEKWRVFEGIECGW